MESKQNNNNNKQVQIIKAVKHLNRMANYSKSKHTKPHNSTTPKNSHRALLMRALPLLKSVKKLTDLQDISDLKKERALILNAARGMFDGNKVYDFYIGSTFNLPALGTSGTLSVQSQFYTQVQASDNWSPLSSLFDECVLDEIAYSLVPLASGFNVAIPFPTFLAVDDDSNGSPPSVTEIVDYPDVRMFCPAVQGATLTTEANSTGFKPIEYSYKRPYSISNHQPSVTSTQSTGWIDVGSIGYMQGSLLAYNGGVTASNNATVYIVMTRAHMRFRFVR